MSTPKRQLASISFINRIAILSSLMMITSRSIAISSFRNVSNYFRRSVSSPSDNKCLIVETTADGSIVTLTLNRLERANALDRTMMESLHQQVVQQSLRDTARVIILQSNSPKVFCAGHDLNELQTLSEEEQTELFWNSSNFMQYWQEELAVPTICAIEGIATGAGCQWVAASDFVVASPQAGFCTPGVQLGLFCHTPAVPLVRAIGVKRAMDMLYTGRTVSAEEALRFGLVTRVEEQPRHAARELAQVLASRVSQVALRMGKKTLYQQASAPTVKDAYRIATPAMLDNLQNTYDARHGIGSFLQKKVPEWKHN